MQSQEIVARGFNHWILGTADLEPPILMPTHLPYEFTDPDAEGRVPFADVTLASTYKWAMDPENGHPLHDCRGTTDESLNDVWAVNRCILLPYMYAFYGSQRFIEASATDPNAGTVDTASWRESTARQLLKESGVVVTWIDEPPTIGATRSPENPLPTYWDMENVSYFHTGRVSDQEEAIPPIL